MRRMGDTQVMPVGLIGHGMAVSPRCPCRFVVDVDESLFLSSEHGGSVISRKGARPAAGDLAAIDGATDPTWRFGADGPSFALVAGRALGDAIARVDAGISDGPWNLLMAGAFIDLPPGLLGYSPTTPDDPYPELHLRDPAFRGLRTIRDAFIQFTPRPVAAAQVRITGDHEVHEHAVPMRAGTVRVFDYAYELDDAIWRKRHYALPVAPERMLMMSAQAPAGHAALMFERADAIAASFEPATLPAT
jgi:hypothetical protein